MIIYLYFQIELALLLLPSIALNPFCRPRFHNISVF